MHLQVEENHKIAMDFDPELLMSSIQVCYYLYSYVFILRNRNKNIDIILCFSLYAFHSIIFDLFHANKSEINDIK